MAGRCSLHGGVVLGAGYARTGRWPRLEGMGGIQIPASPARPGPPGGAGRPGIPRPGGAGVRAGPGTQVALPGGEEAMEVAVAVASGDEIVPAALEHRPDVALLDIGLPGADGLTAAAELVGRLPGCRVLILTGLQASGNLSAAMRAGAYGFLLKDKPADELIGAVRAGARGERVVDSRLARPPCHPERGPGQAREPGPGR